MPETEHYTFMLPPSAWRKKPHPSSFKMTLAQAAEKYPGAEPILSTREVRSGTTDAVISAADILHGREHG